MSAEEAAPVRYVDWMMEVAVELTPGIGSTALVFDLMWTPDVVGVRSGGVARVVLVVGCGNGVEMGIDFDCVTVGSVDKPFARRVRDDCIESDVYELEIAVNWALSVKVRQ